MTTRPAPSRAAVIAKLQSLLPTLDGEIKAKRASASNSKANTRKRVQEAQHAENEAQRLERLRAAIVGLAQEEVPPILAGFTTRKQIEALLTKQQMPTVTTVNVHLAELLALARRRKVGLAATLSLGDKMLMASKSPTATDAERLGRLTDDQIDPFRALAEAVLVLPEGKHKGRDEAEQEERFGRRCAESIREDAAEVGRFRAVGIRTFAQFHEAKAALQALAAGNVVSTDTPEMAAKRAERELVGMKIPGFFPTPIPLAKRLVEEAGLRELFAENPALRVLEPSAGAGSIALAIREVGVEPEVVERSSTLRDILAKKNFKLVGDDIMTFTPSAPYDAILMNPPFEDGQDSAHVRRAYDMLKPGGVLVAIMSAGTFNEGSALKRNRDFQQWVQGPAGGRVVALPEGAFKTSAVPTGVATVLLTLHKKGVAARAQAPSAAPRQEAPAPAARPATAAAPAPAARPATAAAGLATKRFQSYEITGKGTATATKEAK